MSWNKQGVPFANQQPYHQQGNYHPQNKPQFKKSGAKYSKITKGNYVGLTIINAWNKSKSKGMITVSVAPYHKSKVFKAKKNGNEYQTMLARVNYLNTGVEKVIPCCMNTKTMVVGLTELGMCISPKGSGQTSSGKHVTGYFGTFKKS